ncbi:MAG: hypothetical protein R3E13_00545 [Alphaproteobacteria bacterium]
MLQHFIPAILKAQEGVHAVRRHFALFDLEKIMAVDEALLSHDMPVVKKGVLYIDGEGTATAAVAQEAAKLFNEGNYDCVVMAGGRKPHQDPKKHAVFPQVLKSGLHLPQRDDTEAEYAAREFSRYADHLNHEKWKRYAQEGRIHVISRGNAASDKVEACRDIFNKAGLVQAVTLPYTVPRLVGTFKKYAPDVAVTAKGVWPFGITRDNWKDWHISHGVVMREFAVAGPGKNGEESKYEKAGYFIRTDLEEAGKKALAVEANCN